MRIQNLLIGERLMVNKKILLIEDERKITRFLELELMHEGYLVHCEHNGQNGLQRAENNHYDLILLDIMLPGLNGLDVCRNIRQKSDTPIIMLTARDDTADIVAGLDSGANDYITKPFAVGELLARIRTVFRSTEPESCEGGIFRAADLTVDTTRHIVKRGESVIEMTRLEFDLLLFLLRNKGIVVSRNQVLSRVWGFDYIGQTNIVDVYINYLRNKIDKGNEIKLIKTVRGIGYYIEDEALNE
jgi:Response regulators consisting of a CheY-like receiver domain and a winged-helix DNA-binding domain